MSEVHSSARGEAADPSRGPQELAAQYRALSDRLPWLNVFGGCCGTDLRHVPEMARPLR